MPVGSIGSAIPGADTISDVASTLQDLFQGSLEAVADVILTLLIAPITLIVYLLFRVLLGIIGWFYNIMVGTVTATPHPRSDGQFVIFQTPDGSFAGLQDVMENGIIPMSLLLVVFGIALVLFIRVFDVAIPSMGFDGEEAQKRLLIAPILISLWIPLANIILLLAHGLTDFFLIIGESIEVGEIFEDDDNIPASIEEDDELSVMGMFRSLTPTGVDITDGPIDFIASIEGDAVGSLLVMLFGITMTLFIVPVAIIVAILATIRVILLYVMYVLGPIGIMLWAIKWRSIADFGEKIIRNFVLLALFPVPAAIVISIMPVVIIGAELAIIESMAEIFGDNGESAEEAVDDTGMIEGLGLTQVLRANLAMAAIMIIGFAPWGLVIGFGKAAALAGGAAVAGGAVATGGTALAAGGAMKGMGSVASTASSAAGTAAKTATNKSSKVSKAASATTSAASKASDVKSKMGEKTPDQLHAAASSAGKQTRKTLSNYEIADENGKLKPGAAASGAVNKTGDVLETYGGSTGKAFGGTMKKATEGGKKGLKAEKDMVHDYREKRTMQTHKKELAENSDLTMDELRFQSAAAGNQLNKEDAREIVERNDDLSWKDVTGRDDEELDMDGIELLGEKMMSDINSSDIDLEEKYGSSLEETMHESVKELDHSDFQETAKAYKEKEGEKGMYYDWVSGDMEETEQLAEGDGYLAGIDFEGRGTINGDMEEFRESDLAEAKSKSRDVRTEARKMLEEYDHIDDEDVNQETVRALMNRDTETLNETLDNDKVSEIQNQFNDSITPGGPNGKSKINDEEAFYEAIDQIQEDFGIDVDEEDMIGPDGEIDIEGLDFIGSNGFDAEGMVGQIRDKFQEEIAEDFAEEFNDLDSIEGNVTESNIFNEVSSLMTGDDGPATFAIKEMTQEIQKGVEEGTIQSLDDLDASDLSEELMDSQSVKELRKETAKIAEDDGMEAAQEYMEDQLEYMKHTYTEQLVSEMDDMDIDDMDPTKVEDMVDEKVMSLDGVVPKEMAENMEETIETMNEQMIEQSGTMVGDKFEEVVKNMNIEEHVPNADSIEEISASDIQDVNIEDMDSVAHELKESMDMADSIGKMASQRREQTLQGVSELMSQVEEDQAKNIANEISRELDDVRHNAEDIADMAQNEGPEVVAHVLDDATDDEVGIDDAQVADIMDNVNDDL